MIITINNLSNEYGKSLNKKFFSLPFEGSFLWKLVTASKLPLPYYVLAVEHHLDSFFGRGTKYSSCHNKSKFRWLLSTRH